MAEVLITLKVMPDGTEIDIKNLEKLVSKEIKEFGGRIEKVEIEPIAFGLQALKIIFSMDERKGSTDALENKISDIDGISSVEVTDVRRMIG
ncbi:MAG: elongation factor 1-beta [Candidatus Woesearchaeota archaeon]|nr:elongation factor 1-beta [Candidatus Woesearchaeota archaeon]